MQTNALRHLLIAAGSVVLLSACAIQQEQALDTRSTTTAAYAEGVPGGTITRQSIMLATVKAIDYVKRTVTLLDAQGHQRSLVIAPEAVNFAQVAKGDLVKVTLTEELIIFVQEAPLGDSAALLAATAAPGSKPHAVVGETVQSVAEVRAVDLTNHTATLRFADGSVRTVAVRPDVALSEASLGKTVVMQTTQAVAVAVDKP